MNLRTNPPNQNMTSKHSEPEPEVHKLKESFYSQRQRLVLERFDPADCQFYAILAKYTEDFCASLFHFDVKKKKKTEFLKVRLFLNLTTHNPQYANRKQVTRIETVQFEVKLLNALEQVIYFKGRSEVGPMSFHDRYHNTNKITLNYIPLKDLMDKNFPGGKLIVQVEIFQINGESPFRAYSLLPEETTRSHSTSFGSLLKSGKFSDFTVVVKGREFKTHKLVLAAQSPVFAAMLEHSSTKEVREGRLEMTDLDEDVFEQLLEFVYTGQVNDHFVADLFIAANKYQMDSLRSYCDHFMRFNLSDDTVADIFTLAGMFNAPELRERCIRYMIDNCQQEKLKPIDWWKSMERSQLESELFENFSKLRATNNNKRKLRELNETTSQNKIVKQ